MKPLRIALCGRGGTGKTTLAHELSRVLFLPVISECVRTATRSLRIESIRDLGREDRLVLQAVALHWQVVQEAQHSHSGFVSDRSAWDYLAYSGQLIPGSSGVRIMGNLVAPSYDLLIHVPPHGAGLEDDGFRFADPAFEQIEKRVDEALAAKADVTLKARGKEERVAEVLALIKERAPE